MLVADAVYRKCDAADGVADGLIDDPRLCAVKPDVDVPHCPNDADAPGCLTSAQAQVLETIYAV